MAKRVDIAVQVLVDGVPTARSVFSAVPRDAAEAAVLAEDVYDYLVTALRMAPASDAANSHPE